MATRATWLLLALVAGAGCGDGDTDSGGGDEEAPPGRIEVSPTAIDVGELDLHEQASAELTISNVGEGALKVYDVQLADDTMRAHWTLQGGKSGELDPGDSTRIVVIANPGDIIDLSSRLDVLSDDPSTPIVVVTLEGSSHGEASVRVSPTTADVGAVPVGDSATAEITIANDGSAGLQVTAVSLGDEATPWSIVLNPLGTTVAPQSEDGRAILKFSPVARGLSTTSLLIGTSDPSAGTVTVTLLGTGT